MLRLKEIFQKLAALTGFLGAASTVICCLVRRGLIRVFPQDETAAAMGEQMVIWLLLAGPLLGLYYLSSNFLQAPLTDILEQQKQDKAKAGAAYEDNGLVFCTKLGRPQDPINMRRTFYRICDKAGISDLHSHCLRHTFATRGAEKQVDIRVMQRFLGHANIQETVNTYTHIQPDTGRAQMELLEKVVNY